MRFRDTVISVDDHGADCRRQHPEQWGSKGAIPLPVNMMMFIVDFQKEGAMDFEKDQASTAMIKRK
jgi:hypothetical protein